MKIFKVYFHGYFFNFYFYFSEFQICSEDKKLVEGTNTEKTGIMGYEFQVV